MAQLTKSYYSIGEVTRILDLPKVTIYYWEDKIPMFKSQRTQTGRRRYTPENIKLAMVIKSLIYERGMKVAGVAKYLEANYRKHPPRRQRKCASKDDAIRLLQEVESTLGDAHAIAKLKAVMEFLKDEKPDTDNTQSNEDSKAISVPVHADSFNAESD